MMTGLFWITACVVTTTLGLAAAPVVWRLAGYVDLPPAAVATNGGTAASRVDLAPILAFAPFGTASAAAQPDAPLPISETGLVLLGIALADPESRSRAMIAGGDMPVLSYGAGSTIAANTILKAVLADHVILEVNGQAEALYFAAQGDTAVANDLENLIVAAEPAASENVDTVIAAYRAQIMQNPQTVMDRLGLEATTEGYRITDTAIPGVRQAGFQPGDLVTMVNGQRVGNVADDQIYFDEVAASDRATVEVMREGQTIVMTFPLR